MIADIVRQLEGVSEHTDAILEAKLLLGQVLDEDYKNIHLSEKELDESQTRELDELIQRRLSGEPIQYILGEWEFMGLPFYVQEGVLIPRQDTETLCEEAIHLIQEHSYRTALDLCCGSGCIGISLAKYTGIEVVAGDISETCLSLTEKNARRNEVSVQTIKTDLFSKLTGKQFDMIACNPPYLNQQEMDTLQKEVRFEPELALFGGEDGLDFYRRIADTYEDYLKKNGTMLLEIGYTQWEEVQDLFPGATLLYDLAKNPRVAVIHKTEKPNA